MDRIPGGIKVVLASKSPRRREYTAKICDNFSVITEDTDETLPTDIHPRDGVRVLAERKGEAVIAAHPSDCADALVIAADTLVELNGEPFGKPADIQDAVRMLCALRGRTHNVHTGIAVFYHGRMLSATDSSAVIFRLCSDEEISEYAASGECMDKAGAYGIQGLGGRLVAGLDGEFDTVVGFPTKKALELIEEILK